MNYPTFFTTPHYQDAVSEFHGSELKTQIAKALEAGDDKELGRIIRFHFENYKDAAEDDLEVVSPILNDAVKFCAKFGA